MKNDSRESEWEYLSILNIWKYLFSNIWKLASLDVVHTHCSKYREFFVFSLPSKPPDKRTNWTANHRSLSLLSCLAFSSQLAPSCVYNLFNVQPDPTRPGRPATGVVWRNSDIIGSQLDMLRYFSKRWREKGFEGCGIVCEIVIGWEERVEPALLHPFAFSVSMWVITEILYFIYFEFF